MCHIRPLQHILYQSSEYYQHTLFQLSRDRTRKMICWLTKMALRSEFQRQSSLRRAERFPLPHCSQQCCKQTFLHRNQRKMSVTPACRFSPFALVDSPFPHSGHFVLLTCKSFMSNFNLSSHNRI